MNAFFQHLYDSSDSSDEDIFAQGELRRRNENYLDGTVELYSDKEFFDLFRVSRHVASEISVKYEQSVHFNDQPGQFGNISAYNQVLIFLWYIGHEAAGFVDVCDRFNIALASLERIIRRLAVFISNLSKHVITWPNEQEKQEIQQEFQENGFPNIIGAIDGCHVKIDKPENDPDSYYINRKGYYSIQMQVVCDKRGQIRDIFIGYPGSVHDSRVFRNSPLSQTLAEKCGQYFILGDSGYPLKANLLTPFKDRGQLNARQVNYNLQLAKNRYVIEHCFGMLKQKFRQLFHVKLRKIVYIVHLLRAACVLHNLALKDEFEIENVNIQAGNNDGVMDVNNYDENVEDDEVDADQNSVEIRNYVVDNLP